MAVLRRKIKDLTGRLAAVCLLVAVPASSDAAGLNPIAAGVSASTADFSWSGSGTPWNAVLSETDAFTDTVSSAVTASNSVSYTNLNSNTTYYFKVKRTSDPDAAYETASAVTPAAAPSGIYFNPEGFQAYLLGSIIRIGWETNNNHPETVYQVDYALNGAFSDTLLTAVRGYPPVDIGGLSANTTYYFRVRAVSRNGTLTPDSTAASTATLALGLNGISDTIYETSATVSWNAVSNPINPALNSEGYRLKLSSFSNMEVLFSDWSTNNPDVAAVEITTLDPNTTYYYRVGSLNPYGAMNWADTRTFTTLSVRPQNPRFTGVGIGTRTATLGWDALPEGPSSATALGYRLEASSTDFSGGIVYSSSTMSPLRSTLTVSGLDANTTYYFRVGSVNRDFAVNYSSRLSTITLSVPLSANLLSVAAGQLSITVTIGSPLPAVPQSASCEGYLLEASSQAFGAGSVIYSSASYNNLTNSLIIDGLKSNTLYYLRIASLNWTKTPNLSVLPAALTTTAGALASAAMTGIWQSSAAVSFSPIASDGYVLEASRVSYFDPVAFSSSTTDGSSPGLTVAGLDRNTPYYFRVGALYNGATVYTLTDPARRYTLPLPLSGHAITGVFHTSATVSWTPLAASPSSSTAAGYRLEASTSPDFAPTASTAYTGNPLTGSLTVQDLVPNTSYYFRAGTMNPDGAGNYVYTPAASTLANPPIQTAFTDFATGQLTVNWLANSNPPDTVYFVRFSSSPGYDSTVFASSTLNAYASFSGLEPNTTYYPEVTAVSRSNIMEGPYKFDAMATMAFYPVPGAFSSLGASSITLNWGIGENLTDDTDYKVEISSSPAFGPPVLSTVTRAAAYTFHGLVSNATYYLRISALNRTGVGTPPIPFAPPEALTLPATAYLLSRADTFSDLMTDGFTLHWADNGNSSHTVYNVAISTSENFSAGTGDRAAAVRDLACAFKDLLLGATYWARIQSEGQTGITSDSVQTSSVTTLRSSQAGAIVNKETTVTLQASYGLITVLLPAGSLGGSTRVTIEPKAAFSPPASAVSVLRPTGIGIEITRFPPVLVLNPVTITLPYRLSDLPSGIDRTKLVLALYDEGDGVWVPLPSVSDLAGNKVTAQTWHLSTFQLMEAAPAASLGEVKIYPNPYTPSSVADVMHFTNLPPYAKIKIYTFLGELVKEFSADVNGMAYWDGKNSGGRKAASGVYLALLKTKDGGSGKMVKVVLER
ncbi:MAG: fibronectin type III domain-containing protein [Elusimicrobiales bacterium]|jgi:hypothetical protein